ncbi:hypothetical protein [Acinetobacter tibetensis]|uniref:Uncharacterized protein n=1 Tax=Acinetobacter tibetensis TaxID=2943497 RepID=A0AAE9LST1_9GAMM|nr:hypothetical protein [Acinetobacter tibetensis]USE84043.1 hypothetical protein M5E07_04255 [Acinetobacter tibetensis]
MKLKTAFSSQLPMLNQNQLFYIQWRIQRILSGEYDLNVLVDHDTEHSLILSQDRRKLAHCFDGNEQQTLRLDLANGNLQQLVLGKNHYGITHPEQWKVIFNNLLYPLISITNLEQSLQNLIASFIDCFKLANIKPYDLTLGFFHLKFSSDVSSASLNNFEAFPK